MVFTRGHNNGAMDIEWDPEKAKSNLRKHGVTFDEAKTIFYDDLLAITFDDPDLIVAHLIDDEERIRIINARLANAHERNRHES